MNLNESQNRVGVNVDRRRDNGKNGDLKTDFDRVVRDVGRKASDMKQQAARIAADIPPNAANVGRAVGIGLAAGTAAAFAAPVIAAAGIAGAGALATSAAVGAVAAVSAGEVIDRIDSAVHAEIGEKGNFAGNSPVADAVTGASLGLNIQAMSMAHGLIQSGATAIGSKLAAIPALSPKVAAGVGKAADFGMHTGLHLAVDTSVETANQLAQSAIEKEPPRRQAERVRDGLVGTIGPSVASTAVVELVESRLPGSRPAVMSVMEGLEAASRQGGVSAVQQKRQSPSTDTPALPTRTPVKPPGERKTVPDRLVPRI